jgi:hypothetical protein
MRRFLITAMMIAATISSVNAQTTSRPEPAKLDENCNPIPTGRSWSELGADAPRVLEEGRRQTAACREALMLRQQKEYAARTTGPNEPLPFVLRDVISFAEPTLSCPDPDDAEMAEEQAPEWLASRGCKNLDPNVKRWVVVTAGSRWLKPSGLTTLTWGCVVSKERWDETKAESDRRDTYHLGTYEFPRLQQLGKECRYVVRRIRIQAAHPAKLPDCDDPAVTATLRRVAGLLPANDIHSAREMKSDDAAVKRWCFAEFSAPYPGLGGSYQEAVFTLEWIHVADERFWLQIKQQRRSPCLIEVFDTPAQSHVGRRKSCQ